MITDEMMKQAAKEAGNIITDSLQTQEEYLDMNFPKPLKTIWKTYCKKQNIKKEKDYINKWLVI